jgi:hypothetical protein
MAAPSVPHALHMPSHIFSRLGMWGESISSNMASRKAAEESGDPGIKNREFTHATGTLVASSSASTSWL